MVFKFPTLEEVLADESVLDKLTEPQKWAWLKQVKKAIKGVIPTKPQALESPAACALALSRGEWKPTPHLELLNEALVALIAGELRTTRGEVADYLVVSMPPRHGKSWLISWWFVVWFIANFKKLRVILTSSEFTFAETWGRQVRDTLIEYGEQLGVRVRKDAVAASEWLLETGGGMKTAGAGSSIIGRGANLFIIDDPHATPAEARSLEMQAKLWDWFETVAKTRLEPGGKMVLIGTRWHQTDLIGRVVADGEAGKLKVYELKLPALAEANDPLDRDVDEPLWEARYSKEHLLQIRNADSGYNWSSVYQQRPTPEEGTEVLRTWWKIVDEPPAAFDELIQSWDFTFKKKKKSDFVVGQVWGRVGAMFYLLYQIRERMGINESLTAFRGVSQHYKLTGVKLIEDKANGPAVADLLRHEIPGIVTWPPAGTKMTSKEERVAAVSPAIRSGNVHLVKGNWNSGYIDEFAAFPNGPNDDQVDATTQALIFLRAGGWHAVQGDWNKALSGIPPKNTTEMYEIQVHKLLDKKLQEGVARLQGQQQPYVQVRRVRGW